MLDKLIQSVMSHPYLGVFVSEIMDQTNGWFFDALARLANDPQLDGRHLKKTTGNTIESHLILCHTIRRLYGVTKETRMEFLRRNPDVPQIALAYLINTLALNYDEVFRPAVIAIKIAVERREDEFGRFMTEGAGKSVPHRRGDEPLEYADALDMFALLHYAS